MRKYRVLKTEFYNRESFDIAIKNMKRKAFWGSLYWGFFMFVMNCYIFPTLWGDALKLNWVSFFIWIGSGFLFGLFMYFIGKSQLNLVTDGIEKRYFWLFIIDSPTSLL